MTAVIISVDGTTPRLVTMGGPVAEGLPSTHLDDTVDRTLEKAVRHLVGSEVGLPVRYFEQLYTFGDQEMCIRDRPWVLPADGAWVAISRARSSAAGSTGPSRKLRHIRRRPITSFSSNFRKLAEGMECRPTW